MNDFVYPKNPKVFEIVKNNSKRYLALERIKGDKGFCKWCLTKIENTRKKYCSKDCKDSAWAFFYPQKYAYKFLSHRQNGACAHCGYKFEDKTKKRTLSFGTYKKWDQEKKNFELIKDTYQVDDMGDVDHIIPIHKGGEILGIENHQLLCRECHIKKSAKERTKDNQ